VLTNFKIRNTTPNNEVALEARSLHGFEILAGLTSTFVWQALLLVKLGAGIACGNRGVISAVTPACGREGVSSSNPVKPMLFE
jgi:hypothetical protein